MPKFSGIFIEHDWTFGIVKIGYGGPKVSRGLHPSGLTDNLVYRTEDLQNLDPKKDGIRLGHSVGAKNRRVIVAAAIKAKFKVFNARVSPIGSKS